MWRGKLPQASGPETHTPKSSRRLGTGSRRGQAPLLRFTQCPELGRHIGKATAVSRERGTGVVRAGAGRPHADLQARAAGWLCGRRSSAAPARFRRLSSTVRKSPLRPFPWRPRARAPSYGPATVYVNEPCHLEAGTQGSASPCCVLVLAPPTVSAHPLPLARGAGPSWGPAEPSLGFLLCSL